MPVSYRIDKGLKTIHTKCNGNVTFGEVLDHFHVLEQDPDCPERLDVLLDLTECSAIPESDQLRTVGATIGRIREKVRFDACAIVASSDIMFGMARMFQVFAEDRFRLTRVFRNLDEGRKWLVSMSPD
jgi:hypothetical protein